uniref:Uncharacterized protein LOC111120466 isoform X3 n=1 Tax=Crassostrea virginica TaxID=6565 RepID=A0A8B8CM24_CRAVI|nr:uncharacterized protein LOC111120466 isoform X3 [Crassostrea virginica]
MFHSHYKETVFICTLYFITHQILVMGTAYRVNDCPRDEKEWQHASRRLNCSDDVWSPMNRYHCLPADNLTTLLEFCYNRTRTQVVKGLCMVFIEVQNIVNHYDCSSFKEGCPNNWYFSNEMYKFPACFEIEPTQRCYLAEAPCQPTTRHVTGLLDTTLSTLVNETSKSTTAGTNDEGFDPLPVIYVTLLIGVAAAFVLWMNRRKLRKCAGFQGETMQSDETYSLLEIQQWENIKADIDELGIKYILQLPDDQKIYPLIAKELKIPQEILKWGLDDRRKFVRSMEVGSIPVYNGRAMVIGCAHAGKTTLVKKMKGDRNLNTESTSGIEIHSHIFKLNSDESTIEACAKIDQQKGCLCLSPSILEKSEENTTETPFCGNEEVEPDRPDITKSSRTPKVDNAFSSPTTTEVALRSDIDDVIYDTDPEVNESDQPINNSTSAMDVSPQKFHAKLERKYDLNDCTASVNTDNLKMLSLLDFAGHSAYYACHHIFFSPRAVFILVVDMTKELSSVASEACKEQNLIYSDWTYADYIRYWLGSIHTYSSKEAPVILAISHAEAIGADSKKALEYFHNEICESLPKELLIHLDEKRVFAFEKESDKNIKDLKKRLASTVKSQRHWGEQVPISWTKLESALRKLQESSNIYPFGELLTCVLDTPDLGIKNEEELINALTFFHETGIILFRPKIKSTIILDVQWLVDAFKLLILDEKHVKDKHHLAQFNELNRHGLLSSKLLIKLWENDDFHQHKDILVDHMKQLDMLAEISKEKWYVPCMNKQKYSSAILKNCQVSSRLCFSFKFLPFDIYHSLVVSCINNLEMKPWEREGRICIYHTVSILICTDRIHRVLIGICYNKESTHTDYPYSIEIQTNVTNPREINSYLTSKLIKDISETITLLTQGFSSWERHFHVGYRCKLGPFGGNQEGHIIAEEDLNGSEFDCHKCSECHVVDVKSILCYWENLARWVSSLQTARVTRWGQMLSSPDPVLQAVIKRALTNFKQTWDKASLCEGYSSLFK